MRTRQQAVSHAYTMHDTRAVWNKPIARQNKQDALRTCLEYNLLLGHATLTIAENYTLLYE